MQELNLPCRGQNPMPCRSAYPLCESIIIRLTEITLDGFHACVDTPIPSLRRRSPFSATPYGVGEGVGVPLPPLAPKRQADAPGRLYINPPAEPPGSQYIVLYALHIA